MGTQVPNTTSIKTTTVNIIQFQNILICLEYINMFDVLKQIVLPVLWNSTCWVKRFCGQCIWNAHRPIPQFNGQN